MSENKNTKIIFSQFLNNLKTGVQLVVSMLWLASILVRFSNEDS